jgi:hypothetical protein
MDLKSLAKRKGIIAKVGLNETVRRRYLAARTGKREHKSTEG